MADLDPNAPPGLPTNPSPNRNTPPNPPDNRSPGRFAQNPPPDAKDTDSYAERLIKYIPADIVAAYVAIDGILKQGGNDPHWLNWAVFGGLLVLTPLYVMYKKTEPSGFAIAKCFHAFASALAFTVWVFALGGPFALTFTWYKPVLGAVLLIFTTLLLPVLEGFFYSAPNRDNVHPGS